MLPLKETSRESGETSAGDRGPEVLVLMSASVRGLGRERSVPVESSSAQAGCESSWGGKVR